jgi:hypothetical protein
VYFSVHQDGGRLNTEIPEILDTEARIAEIWMSFHHPEIASAVQVYRVLGDIENLAGNSPAKVGEALSGYLLWIVRRKTEQTFVKV